jgi:hypothetical protein
LAGKNAARLKATDVIWEFFRKHASPSNDEAGAAAPSESDPARQRDDPAAKKG